MLLGNGRQLSSSCCADTETSIPSSTGYLTRRGSRGGGGAGAGDPGPRDAIQGTPFNSIQAPVHHWVPSSGSNFVSAPADSVTHRSKQVPELGLISRSYVTVGTRTKVTVSQVKKCTRQSLFPWEFLTAFFRFESHHESHESQDQMRVSSAQPNGLVRKGFQHGLQDRCSVTQFKIPI